MTFTHKESLLERLQLLLGHLGLPARHVRRLLGVEGIRDAADHKHVQLQPLPPLLVFPLGLLRGILLVLLRHEGWGGAGRTDAVRPRAGVQRRLAEAVTAATCRKNAEG